MTSFFAPPLAGLALLACLGVVRVLAPGLTGAARLAATVGMFLIVAAVLSLFIARQG